jgi:predicted MFS family arabinose efflux permease
MKPFAGLQTFTVVWVGQTASMMGSALTRFALLVWAWEQTEAATPLVLIGFFSTAATLFTNLIAGPLVDRWDRKRTMLLGDLGAGLASLVLLLVMLSADLQFWHVYLAVAVAGVCGTFQSLAFSASIALIVPKAQLGRANGLLELSHYVALVAAPFLAGVLIPRIGLAGIIALDLTTFLVAVVTLLFTRVPPFAPDSSPASARSGWWRQVTFGFVYIFRIPSLAGLLMIIVVFNLIEAIGYPLIAPMILARTGGDSVALGLVQGVMGIGGIVGGVLISVWGGPRRRMTGILAGLMLTGVLGDALMGLGRSLPVWIIAGFCLECFIPMIVSANSAIWQSKVPVALQGRVFAARRTLSALVELIALLLGGVLADQVFEPALAPDGALAGSLGRLVGVGPGAGMGLLIVGSGVVIGLVCALGFLWPALREIETRLPDQNQAVGESVPAVASNT